MMYIGKCLFIIFIYMKYIRIYIIFNSVLYFGRAPFHFNLSDAPLTAANPMYTFFISFASILIKCIYNKNFHLYHFCLYIG